MVKLDFAIDENYLLVHSLLHGNSVLELKAQTTLSSYGVKLRRLLNSSPQVVLDRHFETLPRELQMLLLKLKPTEEFQQIFQGVQRYKDEVEREWLSEHDRSLAMMQEITGLNFEGDELTVYFTIYGTGRYLGDGRIGWPCDSHQVAHGLWHEIMHSKLPSSLRKGMQGGVSHAVIELATDNELSARLYNRSYPPTDGHFSLYALREVLLPHWLEYLNSPKRDILEFDKRMREPYGSILASLAYNIGPLIYNIGQFFRRS